MTLHLNTQQIMRDILSRDFEPEHMEIIDESSHHQAHAEAQKNPSKGHFRLILVSKRFNDLNLLKRHQLVHESLATLIKENIHALSMKLKGTNE